MNHLQEQLLLYPLTNIIFHTPFPLKLVSYEEVIEEIPEHFLEKQSILYLYTIEDCEKILQTECIMRLIQDSKIQAILVASNHLFTLEKEILFLLHNEKIPFIQLTDKRLASIWIKSQQEVQTNFISTELQRLTKQDLSFFLRPITTGIQVSFLYLDEEFQPLVEVGNIEEVKNLKQWLNVNLRKLVMKEEDFSIGEIEIIDLFLADKKENHLLIKKGFTNWQNRWIHKIANLLALVHHTNSLFFHVQTKQKEQFIIDLLFAKEESASRMLKRGEEFGWNLKNPHFLFLLDRNLSGINELVDHHELLGWLRHWSRLAQENIKVETYQDQFILFIEISPEQEMENKKKYIIDCTKTLISDLKEAFPLVHFQIGVGNFYESFRELHKSYQEAKLALKFGQYLNQEVPVYHINDLGMIRLLLYNHEEVLREFSKEYLEDLILSDNIQGTEYIKTLNSYIKYNGNISEVSKHLFIHQNTLRNRLKKMEEITGIELSNLQQVCHLIIALQIKTLIESTTIS